MKKENGVVPFPQLKFNRVTPKNNEQKHVLQIISDNNISIILGKSGCGKTHLAAGYGAHLLNINKIEKIIVSRAAIGAEDIGYKPGSSVEKMSMYLNPILYELDQYLDVKRCLKEETIVIQPIDGMRGMTFKNAYVIIEEIQNCTYDQLKLILTRFGENSKFVLTGDTSQSDLNKRSADEITLGLRRLDNDLARENGIAVVEMKINVRHPIVDIVLKLLEPSAVVY